MEFAHPPFYRKFYAKLVYTRADMRSTFWLSGLVANPFEGPCGDQAHNQEIVAAETAGVLPCVSVLIRPLEVDIEQRTFLALLAPDACADGTVTDFMDGLVV